ncbi:MAG: polyprenyl synthetase family protein [Nitrospirales bacterium]|nr:polyprenyl synthetase family protein [Nitrospirales bacterium]
MADGQPVAPVQTIEDVWEAYQEDIDEVEAHIRRSLDEPSPLIKEVGLHILNGGGKRIRPLLLILCAHLCGYIAKKDLALGSFIEFIHTATLLHDDVLDEADLRRGQQTARRIWGNKTSILVGDYLYSLAMSQIAGFQNHGMNETLSDACRKMAEGEILQLCANYQPTITESDYLRIIEYKTGALVASTCKVGAIIGGATPAQQAALYHFGLHLGMAFQLADDRLDYIANGNRLGKTLGQDLKQGMVTLPLLHLLQHCSTQDRETIIHHMINQTVEEKDLLHIINLMNEHGSMAYAAHRAQEFIDAASLDLKPFDDCMAKRSLRIVAGYMLNRDR